MKGKLVRSIAAMALGCGGMFVVAGDALASSSSFSWTMNRRHVSGKKNGVYHTLDGGELTLTGKLWVADKKAAAASTPQPLTIRVMKESSSESDAICSVTVVPDTTLNVKKEFSRSCGRVESGKYWVSIDKVGAENPDGDGWHNRGSGTLTTK